MTVAIVLFTSDLRLHDHPPLHAALASSDEVVPLFVLDPGVEAAGFAAPNRRAFLADCLRDLDSGLRDRGGRLVVREGEVAEEVGRIVSETEAACGAHGGRDQRLRAAPGGAAAGGPLLGGLPAERARRGGHRGRARFGGSPGAGRDHFAVFTPYFRRWSGEGLRSPFGAPRKVRVPEGPGSAALPSRAGTRGLSPGLAEGGETEGRRLFTAWRRDGLASYEDRHDDMAGDATSRLSPHLHFGTLSPTELVHRARATGGPGAEAFVRQVCWRDFHHQVLAARPAVSRSDYRPKQDRWRTGRAAEADTAAWKEGRTGYPVVDAAMRQLLHEGWMHNRGRLLTASFLAKTLYVDWRTGARHFLELLVDGDIANNQLNWQWVAGTGTDSRPNRVLNPVTQAKRYDPEGAYVRRWVPELAGIPGSAVHEPWKLPREERRRYDYPEPVVGLSDGLARFKEARGLD